MALFGRRKPGFSKEVKLNPDEIPGEFSDALDPAVNRELDNPKAEKRILQESAEKVINGEKGAPDGDKQDILDYLESLPDVEDPFPPSEPEEEAPVEETPKRPGADSCRLHPQAQCRCGVDLAKIADGRSRRHGRADCRDERGRGLQGYPPR